MLDEQDVAARSSFNLGYQDLGEPYQLAEFKKLMHKVRNVQRLVLSHNKLRTLRGYAFPQLEELVLVHNDLRFVKELPTAPRLRVLNVAHNHFVSLSGLGKRFPLLEHVTFRGCPVEADNPDYRDRVVNATSDRLVSIDGRALNPPQMTRPLPF